MAKYKKEPLKQLKLRLLLSNAPSPHHTATQLNSLVKPAINPQGVVRSVPTIFLVYEDDAIKQGQHFFIVIPISTTGGT